MNEIGLKVIENLLLAFSESVDAFVFSIIPSYRTARTLHVFALDLYPTRNLEIDIHDLSS